MARTKELLRKWAPAMCEELCRETFTHVMVADDGAVLRGDPAESFWYARGCSWYGVPPAGWDAAKATEETFTRSYVEEVDYS
jgi:hypothetical protein